MITWLSRRRIWASMILRHSGHMLRVSSKKTSGRSTFCTATDDTLARTGLVDFRARLLAAQREKRSSVCVGLDPRLDQLSSSYSGLPPAEAILAFNKSVIDEVADVAVAVKP